MRGKFRGMATGIGVVMYLVFAGTAFAAPDEQQVLSKIQQEQNDDVPNDSLQMEEDLGENLDLDIQAQDITTEQLQISDLRAERDPTSGGFRYTLPNDTWFSCNIPAGSVTTGTIQLTCSDDLYLFEVKRDDSFLNPSESSAFSEAGTYEFLFHTGNLDVEEPMVFYELPVSFQICGPVTNTLSRMEVPYGFHIQEALQNGTRRQTSGNPVILDTDGTWQITFALDTDPQVIYRLEFILDREAPELWFSKPIDQGAVRAPLTIKPLEKDCEILVKKGSEPVSLQNQAITYGGIYQVVVRDQAGNERSYSVQIRYQVFPSSLGAIILSVLLISGLSIYLLYLRRHIQIL